MNLQQARAIIGPVRRQDVKRLAASLASLPAKNSTDQTRLAAARLILRHK